MRDVPQTAKTFTFSNGATVRYAPISSFFMSKISSLIERQIRDERPTPPDLKTDFGVSQNLNDPDYQAAMSEFHQKRGLMVFYRALVMALQLDPDDRDASLAVVDQLREQHAAEAERYRAMLTETGLDDEPSQMEIWASWPGAEHPVCQYVIWVGCDGDNVLDLVRLMNAIQGHEELEAAVQSTAESFSSDVQGQESVQIAAAG